MSPDRWPTDTRAVTSHVAWSTGSGATVYGVESVNHDHRELRASVPHTSGGGPRATCRSTARQASGVPVERQRWRRRPRGTLVLDLRVRLASISSQAGEHGRGNRRNRGDPRHRFGLVRRRTRHLVHGEVQPRRSTCGFRSGRAAGAASRALARNARRLVVRARLGLAPRVTRPRPTAARPRVRHAARRGRDRRRVAWARAWDVICSRSRRHHVRSGIDVAVARVDHTTRQRPRRCRS